MASRKRCKVCGVSLHGWRKDAERCQDCVERAAYAVAGEQAAAYGISGETRRCRRCGVSLADRHPMARHCLDCSTVLRSERTRQRRKEKKRKK